LTKWSTNIDQVRFPERVEKPRDLMLGLTVRRGISSV
jgi:hypothetical protein